jgi:perosamine synthetase
VPFFRSSVGDEEIARVAAVLRSGWLTSGPAVSDFENDFSAAVGAPHAIAVSSCTTALQSALLALGIRPGDSVITTPMTFCATVQAIEEVGAQPLFVDIRNDLNLDTSQIEHALTPRVKAVLPVHVAGLPCNMEEIARVARHHGLAVLEDAAHAFGAEWRGRPIGSLPFSVTAFSFYANKNITTGEGGMIATDDPDLASRLRLLIAHGMRYDTPDRRWQYDVVERGLKCNMSDVLAAIGIEQLKKAERHRELRERIAGFYAQALAGIPELELPGARPDCRHAWHLYIVRLRLAELEITRDEFVDELAARGVACSVHFKPIPMHSWFAHYGPMKQWPVTAAESQRILSLPIFPGMTETELEYVAVQIRAVIESARKHVYAGDLQSHA